MIAHRHEDMRAEKNDQSDNFDRKSGGKSHDKRQSFLISRPGRETYWPITRGGRDHGQRASIVNEAKTGVAGKRSGALRPLDGP